MVAGKLQDAIYVLNWFSVSLRFDLNVVVTKYPIAIDTINFSIVKMFSKSHSIFLDFQIEI